MRKSFSIFYIVVAIAFAVMLSGDIFGVQTFFTAMLNMGVTETYFVMAGPLVFPFATDPVLTSIAIAYRNTEFIADDVMPRKPVGKKEFKYRTYPKGTFITIPDTRVGRTSAPNRVELGFTELDSATVDDALDDPVPVDDINNAPANYNPLSAAAQFIADLIELKREQRVAATVFNADNYHANNKVVLAGDSQWSDFTDSNPIDAIMAAMDVCFMRPNTFVIGRAAATKLFQHPKVIKAVNGNSGDSGYARRSQLEELFEMAIKIGSGWYNSAKPGQTPSASRLWGKHASLLYLNPMADTMRGVTWGLTAQFGTRIGGKIDDKDVGMHGGVRVRVGESVKEVVTANDVGYFFEDAVA